MLKGLLLGLFPFSTPSLRTGDVRGDFEESSRRNGDGMGQRNVLVLLECFVQRSMAPVFPWGGIFESSVVTGDKTLGKAEPRVRRDLQQRLVIGLQ